MWKYQSIKSENDADSSSFWHKIYNKQLIRLAVRYLVLGINSADHEANRAYISDSFLF